MIKIVEVGPRDGLQNETALIPTDVKIAFINALSTSGVGEIEVSAFVSPQWVPQLGDAQEVFDGIRRTDGVIYSALVPNQQGFERALAANVDKVAVFTSASETFNQKNINATIDESLARFRPVMDRAQASRIPVRGYVSTAFWCAFEGKTDPHAVVEVVAKLMDMGVQEISISDTIGKATPDEVHALLDLLRPKVPLHQIAAHFHDTYDRGVANTLAAYDHGVRIFDASVGGLGGCPYAPGATGNVATEAVVNALEGAGETLGIDRDRLSLARALLAPFLLDELRTIPQQGSPACAVCQFSTGTVCCERDNVPQAAASGRLDQGPNPA